MALRKNDKLISETVVSEDAHEEIRHRFRRFDYFQVHMARWKFLKVGMALLIALSVFYYLKCYGLFQSNAPSISGNSASFPHGFKSVQTETTSTERTRTTALPTTTAAFSDIHTTSRSTAAQLQRRPNIVFWAKQFHSIDWTFPRLANGDGGCEISFNRKDIHKADAVVFFMKSTKPNDLPPSDTRRKDQVYVWFVHESPWTVRHFYRHKLTEYNNYFNWTMSYRMDSDVMAAMWPTPAMDFLMSRVGRQKEMVDPTLESKALLSEEDFQAEVRALLSKKTKLVAWIVSDCALTKGAKHRITVVKSLEDTGIQISKYGKCVRKPLPFNFTILFETLSRHKFYIAFENSLHCQDYLTEKTIYNSFISGSVPVIHGPHKKDVAKILPKGSYIHAEDFENMQKLKDYLEFLDKNDTAYMQYFKWWRDAGAQTFPRFGFNYGPAYVPRNPIYPKYSKSDVQEDWLEYERFGLYHLCRRLKRGDHKNQVHIIPNLAQEWYDREPPECLN